MVRFIGIIKASDERWAEAKRKTQIMKKMLRYTIKPLTVGDIYGIISRLLLCNI